MATAKTTIELNGKLYDARSGKIIGEAGIGYTPRRTEHPKRTNGAVLDGFVRRPQAQAATALTNATVKKTKPNVARTAVAPAATKLQRSKTLMRPAVKKPKAVTKTDTTLSHKHTITKRQDPERQLRAAATPKSEVIRRFNPNTHPHKIVKKQAHLPVATQSSHISQQVAQLATSTEAHIKQSVDVIEESLRNASAHLERFDDRIGRKKLIERAGFRNKTANIASLSFAGILLIGFFAFQNASALEMRVAATRSGVSAHMPGYRPAGFAVSHGIKAQPGTVAVSFKSNTDDRKFTVTQKASNWSSDSLLSNSVLASKQPFQTYQDEGKTVFIYDNSNATWVNGGIWYSVDGNASLTSDQLLRIANSF